MYSLPSASQICEPWPRTTKGGSPPTARNARTGELTPPGISISARFCSLRDWSSLRAMREPPLLNDHYSSAASMGRKRAVTGRYYGATSDVGANSREFHRLAILPQHQVFSLRTSVALLTGRVFIGTVSGAPDCPDLICVT